MKKEKFLSNTIVVVIGALICCFLWGSAFPCIKIGYKLFAIEGTDTASQILFGGIRFILAGILSVLLGSLLQRKFLVPKASEIPEVIKLSSLQTIGQYILFYVGLAHTSGVRASIVEGTNVFVAIFVAAVIFRQEKITLKKIIGSIIGFSGVILINVAGNSLGSGNLLTGDLLIFLSTVCYAFSSVLLKKYSKKTNPVLLSGYQFVFGGLVMTLVGLIFKGKLPQINISGILILIYLAFVSAVAYSLWGILLKYNSISKVAVIGFMNPVFGVILSAILLKEGAGFGWAAVLSLMLICIGIIIVNIEKSKMKGEEK